MYSCCQQTTNSTMKVLQKLNDKNMEIDINDILGRMTFDCFTSIALLNHLIHVIIHKSIHLEPHLID